MLLLLASLLAQAADPDALGRQVAARCGDLSRVESLDFTFVVEKDGAEAVRRSHSWSPQRSTVRAGGAAQPVEIRIEAAMPSTEADPRWATLAPGAPPAQALAAWGAFVNDSYWLLAPCKVMDPGVKRSVAEGGDLELSFEGVGLTPGDRYRLDLDPEARVIGWSFTLQSGREGSFRWTEHQPVGPLELSLRREASDGSAVIRFEGVQARP